MNMKLIILAFGLFFSFLALADTTYLGAIKFKYDKSSWSHFQSKAVSDLSAGVFENKDNKNLKVWVTQNVLLKAGDIKDVIKKECLGKVNGEFCEVKTEVTHLVHHFYKPKAASNFYFLTTFRYEAPQSFKDEQEYAQLIQTANIRGVK